MVVATGFFDGVHLGHRLVLKQLTAAAAERGLPSAVVTFWPHPRTVLQDDARDLRLLTTLDEKKRLFREAGVDRVEVIPFTRAFSKMSTEAYLRDILVGQLGAKTLLLGYDNRMGHDAGTPDEIAAIAQRVGLEVIRTDRFDLTDELTVSSSKIRRAIEAGDIPLANRMLGYPYNMLGVVIAGNRLGRKMGFPTANLQLYEPLKLIPGNGVYHVEVEVLGEHFHGMCNIGVRPTVGTGGAKTIETNIFDFDEDIYGLDLHLTFLEKIRDERRFDSIEALSAQLARDRERCRGML
ncbi:MAG: riboflavin biosynthesis protein RibF [Bacteroidales bacterium]|nr:riboflavin biosynthesis protein RibF [Bacteroidales bacterium]